MYKPGHYHSPYPDLDYIENSYTDSILEFSTEALDINIESFERMLIHLSEYRDLVNLVKNRTEGRFYFENNDFFRYADAWSYATMILYLKPNRIVEVGSGFSTGLSMDINNEHFDNEIEITTIDPNIERLCNIVGENEVYLDVKPISLLDLNLDYFKTLEKNDILFIDSSHVLKQGSDVNYIIFEVLPVLNDGVVVHFHDIFLFNYPKGWFTQGVSWNESYALRAFLSYNYLFKTIFLNRFVTTYMKDICEKYFPELLIGHGGSSLYIVKGEGMC